MKRLTKRHIAELQLTLQLAEEAKKHLSDFALDLGGHNMRGTGLVPSYVASQAANLLVVNFKARNSIRSMELVLKAMKRGGRAAVPLRFGRTCLDRCYVCGRTIGVTFDGKTFGAETVCPYPDGMPEYSMRLKVPSGKLVADDNFCNEYEQDAPDRIICGEVFGKDLQSFKYDVNTHIGKRQVFMFYAKRGMAHGYVGNTCPGIYRLKDGSLTVASCRYDERSGKERDVPGERVGGICTDLWWYSIADHDDFLAHGGKISNFTSIIDVEPGVYTVTHRTHTFDMWENATHHYATIKRTGNVR